MDKNSNTILSLRKKAGLTRRQVYEQLRIPEVTLRNWENGINKCPEYTKNFLEEWFRNEIQWAEIRMEQNDPDSQKCSISCFLRGTDFIWSYPVEDGMISVSVLRQIQEMIRNGWDIRFEKDFEKK